MQICYYNWVEKNIVYKEMQTPPREHVLSKRVPTPQISDRKKRLFATKSDNLTINPIESIEQQYSLLDGIRPLSPDNNLNEIDWNKSVKVMLRKLPTTKLSFLKDNDSIDINMFTKYTEPRSVTTPNRRRSPRSPAINKNVDIEMSSPRKSYRLQNITLPTTPENCKISSPKTPKSHRSTDELGKLFKNSLNFKNVKKKSIKEIISDESFTTSSTDDDESDYEIIETPLKNSSARKRVHPKDLTKDHQSKLIKLDENLFNNKKNQISSIDDIKISTKTFYSNNETKKENKYLISPNHINKNLVLKKSRIKLRKAEQRLFNKGVSHNIKKPLKQQKKISIDDMLKTIRFEKFKFLPSNRLPQDKIDLVHQILAKNKNPIEMAKPLNININNTNESNNLEFSDIENNSCFDDTDSDFEDNNKSFDNKISTESEVILRNNNETEEASFNTAKKFFKSARNTSSKKEITLTNNIKATFSNGKIALKKKKAKKKSKIKILDSSFSSEQNQVNEIIKNLNDSPMKINSEKINIQQEIENISYLNLDNNNTITDLTETNDYSDFKKRLPYKTTDPELIKQQNLLLNFLITNNICNEKNFNIFIADPDNHKEEANEICNSLVCALDYSNDLEYGQHKIQDEFENFRNRIPYKTNDPVKIEEQNLLLDFLIQNQICTEENFKYFITEAENHKDEAELIVNSLINVIKNNDELIQDKENEKQYNNIENNIMETDTTVTEVDKNPNEIEKNKLFPIFYCGRKYQPIQQISTRNKIKINNLWRSALGSNQYQIDAGQKEYGAKQCPQCGLVYTMHEPEEEILHNEYHKSIYVLKFRSWIDEDCIANYPEWGNDGRIIRLKSSCSIKKRDRLMDVLKIVDKELGFSSYILPLEFVAFLAIRKQQIVGLCLVQFLDSANRYISVNGVDCCTEENFEARCGISRIWISPLHRRLRIASKLILSVQSHTITGEFIDLDKIAFSSPTEDGKKFAQKITNRTDFLIYQ